MRMLEYQGKELLRAAGIGTTPEKAVDTVEDALAAAVALEFPVVVKAQVLAGGRGKAGGVRLVRDKDALAKAVNDILGMEIKGEVCEKLLIAKATDIAAEYYAGVTIDSLAGKPVLIFSTEGGVDIETVAEKSPEKVRKLPLSNLHPTRRHTILEELRLAGVKGEVLPKAATVVQKLVTAFFRFDCSTLEINPLAVTAEGDCIALDAKAVIDDAALKRQGFEQTDSLPQTDLERRAAAIGVNYVTLDGDVAVIAGGAGLAMAGMDLVHFSGRKPAGFLDTGGGISSERMAEALRVSIATPGVKGVLVNIFGGINNCAEVARGIATVLDEDNPREKIVVKMRGHSQDEGWALLEARNVPIVKHGTSEEAVRMLVSVMEGC